MTTATAPDLDRAVALFHALSDPIRLRALDLLRGGEMCVCDLQDELDLAQSRLSFHLRVLKDAGLVEDRREGRWSYYTIVPDALEEAHDLVVQFLPRPTRNARTLPMHRATVTNLKTDHRRCCT
jgi:ArsR family transcriptional regulator